MKILPRIAITMGDPAGVGPEIALRALESPELNALCDLQVIGDREILEHCAGALHLPKPDHDQVLHVGAFDADGFCAGHISAKTGVAAFAYVEKSIELALAGQIAAVTTGPLSKEALHLAGIHFPGHTEIYAQRTAADPTCMLQYSEEVRATFVTVHVGYQEVPALLTTQRILDVITLTHAAMLRLRGPNPSLVVLGLNPHAGENGLFGHREEERIIRPAVEAAKARGMNIEGPIPPDTAFIPAKRTVTDAFVCMYHDQGHIPLKALAFDSAVNVTLGLPIIRTSVDHGTACDIAWQGRADPGSLFSAIRLAVQLSQ